MSVALDPQLSVVVEACAGSGKTWMLVSRLIRLLLAGVAPSKILAITYTRKAAAEIEERLSDWLRELASSSDGAALKFLVERGLPETEAQATLPRARGLFEQVVLSDQPPTITTFHGWFVRLVQAAPLTSGLAGFALADASAPLLDEAWARLARRCGREPEGALAQALMELFREPGFFNARQLLGNFISRRAEWRALDLSVEAALERLRAQLGVTDPPSAEEEFFSRVGLKSDAEEFARLLLSNETKTDLVFAERLTTGLGAGGKAWRAPLFEAVLTKQGTPRSRKPSEAMKKRMGLVNAERFLELHASLSSQAQALIQAQQEEAAYALNRAVLVVGEALAHEFDTHKAARRVMDFTDLETHADALLAGDDAAFLQARLDARYQHILLDEFQDTNPLQWRILQSWFDAYGPGEDKPRVFMVGDPKQSIYRFRRAEPRIFGAAGDYLRAAFDAQMVCNDRTWRNAPAVVQVVNALFGAEPVFTGFRPQEAVKVKLPGRVEVVPLVARVEARGEACGEAESAPPQDALRNPLATPAQVAEDMRRAVEAAQLAATLKSCVGRLAIDDEHGPRAARYDDFMLLCRTRTHLAQFEQALRAADIPYFSGSRGGLLDTLEVQDMASLLGFLASPHDDLKLAHSLRTPIFAVSDSGLLALSGFGEGHWWQRLAASVAAGQAEPSLVRAHVWWSRWRELSAHLPVHDVLAAIFDEADVLARYRANVPELMWPAVRANLEAFIRLSLESDGGRYPSLTRFNDELKRLRTASEESPDEGMIAAAEAGGRVRILTIHAAKGLEAPLVWLIDANAGSSGKDGFDVLLDWPPEAHAPRHFSVFGNKASRGHRREHLFEQEQRAAEREELNLLYVAITRARQYFFVSGIEPGKQLTKPTFYSRIRAAVGACGGEGEWGFGQDFVWLEAEPLPATSPAPTLPRQAKLNVGKRRDEESVRQRYGTALHLALECLTQTQPLPPGLDEAAIEHAKRILAAPALQKFFDLSLCVSARNEVEFALPDGSSGRIDRLVDVGDALWVIDYKAGREEDSPLDEYRDQLGRYREVVAQLHPGRPVRCVLIFGDATVCEV